MVASGMNICNTPLISRYPEQMIHKEERSVGNIRSSRQKHFEQSKTDVRPFHNHQQCEDKSDKSKLSRLSFLPIRLSFSHMFIWNGLSLQRNLAFKLDLYWIVPQHLSILCNFRGSHQTDKKEGFWRRTRSTSAWVWSVNLSNTVQMAETKVGMS